MSPRLGGGEVDAALIRSARILYLEGYLFDRPEAKAAFRQAADIAAKAGRQVALSLSDPFCVDRHRPEFLKLIKDSVDILFANEAEIMSLYRDATVRRCRAPGAGGHQARGAHALGEGQRHPERGQVASRYRRRRWPRSWTPPGPATSMRRDSCSASRPEKICETAGKLGSLAAAEIISHIGARPEVKLGELAREQGLLS